MTLSIHNQLDAKHLQDAIDHAAHLLPAQGPITVFIHHNTLHGLEHLPFETALRRAAEIFGCQPYLSEERFRQEQINGRIRSQDITAALLDDLGNGADAFVGFLGTRFHLRRAMLRHPLHSVLPNQLEWVIAEEKSFDCFSSEAANEKDRMIANTQRCVTRILNDRSSQDGYSEIDSELALFLESMSPLKKRFNLNQLARWNPATWESFTLHWLWQICLTSVREYPASQSAKERWRHRDYLLQLTGIDTDLMVNELLIRLGIAIMDQGLSRWHLPDREQGWFKTFLNMFATRQPLSDRWLSGLTNEVLRIQRLNQTPIGSIQESLEALGVEPDEVDHFIEQTLLALRGISGMVWQMEVRADRIAHGMQPGSLTEFLAVRLILERLAIRHIMKVAGHRLKGIDRNEIPSLGELQSLCAKHPNAVQDERNIRSEAFAIFQLAQSLGWLPESLFRLNSSNWHKLLQEIRSFDEIERQKIFQLAFEARYRQQAFDALLTHTSHLRNLESSERRAESESRNATKTLFDVVVCIDEREESLRRHLEEIEPACRTWGFAGFFAVAMYYCAADSFQYVPLCPFVIEPKHYVQETVETHHSDKAQRRSSLRRMVGKTHHGLHAGSRSLMAGALTSMAGLAMTVPLVCRVLFPRTAARLREHFAGFHKVPAETALKLERLAGDPGSAEHQLGFTLDEMANIVERVLRDMGMTRDWSRLVIVLGHGSTTMNNPHESAHDCGACGGGRGGPNARAFTQMANDPRVRSRLNARGLSIPDLTHFVGGFHDTSNDRIKLLDVAKVPKTHLSDLESAKSILYEAAQRNAHERCRRFENTDINIDFKTAYNHVLARSEDLSQVRPEFGHATNALCIVGRRELTRGLFLDRRAFLHSYDPAQDDAKHTLLARILGAVFPVCGGINLEYYFSYVDPEGFGCGTKLPHNIAALVGVMNGAASDLRTGLPWQMVEIHEPIRLLIVIESTPAALTQIMIDNPQIGQMARGGWVQLAILNAEQGTIHWFHQGKFVEQSIETEQLPQAHNSLAWYRGLRGHLDFAQVVSASQTKAKTIGVPS